MSLAIRPAQTADTPHILALVNGYAAENIMLPRTEANIRQTLADWLVAVEVDEQSGSEQAGELAGEGDIPPIAGCGALVPLTGDLVEIRSLAIHASQQGKGLGGQLVQSLVVMAREREFKQVCALTLRENFFLRLGFELVDRWSISPKVWQACIYCPKFHRCDEVAVLMDLAGENASARSKQAQPRPAWNGLLKWNEWQPLKLAYTKKPDEVSQRDVHDNDESVTGADS